MRRFFRLLSRRVGKVVYAIIAVVGVWLLNAILGDAVVNSLKTLAARHRALESFARFAEVVADYPIQLILLLILVFVIGGVIMSVLEIRKLPKHHGAGISDRQKLGPAPTALIQPPYSPEQALIAQTASALPIDPRTILLPDGIDPIDKKIANIIVVESLLVPVGMSIHNGYSETITRPAEYPTNAWVVRFENRIQRDALNIDDLAAQIDYTDQEGGRLLIHAGCWLEEEYNRTSLPIGIRRSLILLLAESTSSDVYFSAVQDNRDGRNYTASQREVTQAYETIAVRLQVEHRGEKVFNFKFNWEQGTIEQVLPEC